MTSDEKYVGCYLSSKKTPDVITILAVLAFLLLGDVVHACPICFRVEENATTDGVQAAVLVLVGVTTVVLGAFGRFVAGFVKRERRAAKQEEAGKC